MSMKTIPLTRGFFTKVDDEDYEKFAVFRWFASTDTGYGVRAVRSVYARGARGTAYLSREILSAPRGRYVDHINGDTLDNQKHNLRVCSNAENGRNSKKPKNNTSGFKGVHMDRRPEVSGKKWIARIKVNRKPIYLGHFAGAHEAAKAYDVAARQLHGTFARLNFPND